MKLKKNDQVVIISGRDKAKRGKIMQIFPSEALVVVEGINIRFKHIKARKSASQGQRIQFAAPLPVGKVMLVCPRCDKPTRVGIQLEGKIKQRVCKKCKQVI